MMDNLARMHPVPVRDIWPSEDRNFTPWLAKNIDLLGDALGFDLEGAETEVSMPDGRRADIVAQYGDQTAIIENQLEASDDDHFVRAAVLCLLPECQDPYLGRSRLRTHAPRQHGVAQPGISG